MKITDLKCTVIGRNPVVRVDTDEGISGLAEVESSKDYLKPHILFYKRFILGQDPTNVERVMLRIRRLGSFKPWGSGVSAIEMALWDIAGKAAGVPVYKLLGGKIRDRVRVYNGGVRPPMRGSSPEDYAENAREMRRLPEGFTIVKYPVGFHGRMFARVPGSFYGEVEEGYPHPNRGLTTERGIEYVVARVKAIKEVFGDEVGLALDCGPGWMVPAAIRLAKRLEPLNVMWLEDLITGDYVPYVLPDVYREVTRSTTTPIHTGEQILRGFTYRRNVFYGIVRRRLMDTGFLALESRFVPSGFKSALKYVPVRQPIPMWRGPPGQTFYRLAWEICKRWNEEWEK